MQRFILVLTILIYSIFGYAQPSNDDCATLINLGEAPLCPIIDTFNNVNATASIISANASLNIPTCFNGAAPDADVWFSFTIPPDGSLVDIQINLDAVDGPNGGILQPQMAVYRGDCGLDLLQEIGCVAAAAGENSLELLLTSLIPGFDYYLRIEDWSATASANWGDFVLCIKEPDAEFIMGTDATTSLCSGTLFDSGGDAGDYGNNENNTFTICPTEAFACIDFQVDIFNIENNFDNLTFFAGADINAPEFVNFTGQGGPSTAAIDSDCVTIQFTSDGSVVAPGFSLSWNCSQTPCPSNFITCDNPEVIPSLPFDLDDLSTCGTLNSQTFGACPFGLSLLDGEDYIFTYTSPGDECISVNVTGVTLNTAVSIYDGCPENSTNCMGAAVNLDADSAFIESSYLQLPGTYYIVVDNGSGCTDFDIFIETVTCPVALPPAALCDDALSINGCGSLPSLIQVNQQMTTEPECIQTGVNSGSWGGIGQGHFTWFYFQAQADGDFGFLANNGNLFEDSDIDINVWGPINSEMELCSFMKTNEPARSTYAADDPDPLAFDFTGLIDINPIDGTPVTDEMEGAGGDGFVSTLPVQNGLWYLVLVNDFSGAIVNGGIQMDFSSTSPGVLDPNPDNFMISQDMTACPNVPFGIEATGGSTYSWFPAAGLSCTDCPNPMVTINAPATYQVAIATACSTDTLSVDLEFMEVDAGVDLTICQGEALSLGAQNTLTNVTWNWENPVGTLDCTDCQNPTLNTTGVAGGNYEFIVTASTVNCSDSDTVLITVLDVAAPQYEIAENTSICVGENIDLGGTSNAGVIYNWSTSGGFSSTDSNPNVTPTNTTTYYLEVSNNQCPNSILDSVTIETVVAPTLPTLDDETICPGEQFQISNITTTNNADYIWSPPAGIIGNTNQPNNIFEPTTTTTYTLVASIGDCAVEESFTLTVNPQVIITIEDATICEGMETTLTASSNLPGTFTWLPGGVTGNTFMTGPLNSSTIYTVSFTGDDGCTAPDEIASVTVLAGVEIISLTADPTGVIPQGNTITLTAETNPTDNLTYDWSTGTSTTVNTTTTVVSTIPNETFSVTVTDALGCSDSETIEVDVTGPEYEIPNTFTPNGDGVNDTFGPIINGDNVTVIDFRIYNRWGEKVHEANTSWDGKIGDKTAASDVYPYYLLLQLPDGEQVQLNGDITLIR